MTIQLATNINSVTFLFVSLFLLFFFNSFSLFYLFFFIFNVPFSFIFPFVFFFNFILLLHFISSHFDFKKNTSTKFIAIELGKFHGECYVIKETQPDVFNGIVEKLKEARYDGIDPQYVMVLKACVHRAVTVAKKL